MNTFSGKEGIFKQEKEIKRANGKKGEGSNGT